MSVPRKCRYVRASGTAPRVVPVGHAAAWKDQLTACRFAQLQRAMDRITKRKS